MKKGRYGKVSYCFRGICSKNACWPLEHGTDTTHKHNKMQLFIQGHNQVNCTCLPKASIVVFSVEVVQTILCFETWNYQEVCGGGIPVVA